MIYTPILDMAVVISLIRSKPTPLQSALLLVQKCEPSLVMLSVKTFRMHLGFSCSRTYADTCSLLCCVNQVLIWWSFCAGDQYIPERFVRRLDRCAAALLMGCSSGRFSPRGDYEPVGVPLSYLMAGCPAAIANLWDVTDGDIDRFSRFLLHKWLGTPYDVDAVTLEQKVQNTTDTCIEGAGHHDSKKKCGTVKCVTKLDKLSDPTKSIDGEMRSKMGSYIGEGRNLCKLPYLIGASPVYYGVPTSITRKEVQ